jgi:hypothetical protein
MSNQIFIPPSSLKVAHQLHVLFRTLVAIFIMQSMLINSLKDLPGHFKFQVSFMEIDTKIEYDGHLHQSDENVCIWTGVDNVE